MDSKPKFTIKIGRLKLGSLDSHAGHGIPIDSEVDSTSLDIWAIALKLPVIKLPKVFTKTLRTNLYCATITWPHLNHILVTLPL
jgi:hypothetical protein